MSNSETFSSLNISPASKHPRRSILVASFTLSESGVSAVRDRLLDISPDCDTDVKNVSARPRLVSVNIKLSDVYIVCTADQWV